MKSKLLDVTRTFNLCFRCFCCKGKGKGHPKIKITVRYADFQSLLSLLLL